MTPFKAVTGETSSTSWRCMRKPTADNFTTVQQSVFSGMGHLWKRSQTPDNTYYCVAIIIPKQMKKMDGMRIEVATAACILRSNPISMMIDVSVWSWIPFWWSWMSLLLCWVANGAGKNRLDVITPTSASDHPSKRVLYSPKSIDVCFPTCRRTTSCNSPVLLRWWCRWSYLLC